MTSAEEAEQVRAQAERYPATCAAYTNEFERGKLIKDWLGKQEAATVLVAAIGPRNETQKGTQMLELGFGSGLYIPAFVKAGAQVYGVEVNNVLLEIAQTNMRERGLTVELQVYDGAHLPYADGYFDYVFSASVLEHVTDVQALLHDVARVLKPGGRAYLSFPNRFAPK